MNSNKNITTLVALISLFAAVAASFGIFSSSGDGTFMHESVRGQVVEIYGMGIYRHMTAEVAIQGIAQDYITLFVAIPLLLIALMGYRRGSLKSLFLLSGILGYFFVTYLFYTAMGTYNIMFLVYTSLLGMSFFALFQSMTAIGLHNVRGMFSSKAPHRFVGGFLIFNALSIAFLWLSMVVPPLVDGTLYPEGLAHYTTLIVQGFDLGLLLPLAFVSGWLLLKKTPLGYLVATTYIIFLSIFMTALTAKIIAMAMNDVNVIPVIFIIPTINLITILCAGLMIRNVTG